ncbi:Pentatricopeptide repeat-containing protein [Ananas comosus]|nr:Pentatricopeptide repeat-containing protein [Ananas comosus]
MSASATHGTHHCYHSLLSSCSSHSHLLQLHAHLLTSGVLRRRTFLAAELLRVLALSHAHAHAHAHAQTLLLHSPLLLPSRSAWNLLIRARAQADSPSRALGLFLLMRRRGLRPNELNLPFVLKSCAQLRDLRSGAQAHADAVKNGVDFVVYVQNTLMLLYGSCARLGDARKVFDDMPLRTVVSWNTMLSACVDNSTPEECIRLFFRMVDSGFELDQPTFLVLLSACAELGCLTFGKWIHGQILQIEREFTLQLGTALVNMYAKCGAITYARRLFEKMSVRNVWTWSAMILGFAQHGAPEEALTLFSQMKNTSVEPNYVTFLGVICACSHAGLADEAYRLFHEMEHVYGIKPMMTHYSAMVDVLGRNGRLLEAYNFTKSMPVEPDAVVWRTLLSACQLHSSKDSHGIGEEVQRKLLALEPRRSGNYVMVANMYSEVGSWEEAAKMRRVMRMEGLKKVAGESCVEVGGRIYRFISGDDDSCIGFDSIAEALNGLNLNMKRTDTVDIIFPIETNVRF